MVLFPSCVCCKEKCDVSQTLVWGGEVSGAPTFTISVPLGEHCIKALVSVSSFSSPTLTVRSYFSASPFPSSLLYSGSGFPVDLCLKKRSWHDAIDFQILNAAGTSGSIEVSCDTCDCNPLP